VFSQHPHALIVFRMVLCEDVGPFQSSKTRAAKAAFFLGADAAALARRARYGANALMLPRFPRRRYATRHKLGIQRYTGYKGHEIATLERDT
jgi:hypothetical protein